MGLRKHKKKQHAQEEVELNLAAMLDMAFQLLTFFILTFKPAPIEGDIVLRLPPPMPTTVQGPNAEALGSNPDNKNPVKHLNTLIISVIGDDTGSIKQFAVGTEQVNGLAGLDGHLRRLFGDPSFGFEQVMLQVGSSVNYDELMQVIDVCAKQKKANGDKVDALALVELPGG